MQKSCLPATANIRDGAVAPNVGVPARREIPFL
jgi:hypothetical protein